MENVNDNYEHPDRSIFYIVSRIPGPGADGNLHEECLIGCTCTENCAQPTCICSLNNTVAVALPVSVPIYECHPGCRCESSRCRNRVIQHGPANGLRIVETSRRGYGLITTQKLSKHAFICEYAGEVISEDEAIRRVENNKAHNRMNYVFILNEFVSDKRLATCVDPSQFGNIGRYINHSCNPNAFVAPVRVGSPVPYLCIFSLREIAADEEVTFDYGAGDSRVSNQQCFCGSQSCRGWLPGTAIMSAVSSSPNTNGSSR